MRSGTVLVAAAVLGVLSPGGFSSRAAFAGASGGAQANPVPEIARTDYGFRVPGASPELGLWWCTAIAKVGQQRPPPAGVAPLSLEAARNEEEALQLVLRPQRDLRSVEVRLSGPPGLKAALRVREVAYVRITRPTDRAGCLGPWPDPLPDHRTPVDCRAGLNQPFWLSVRVFPEAKPGNWRLACRVLCEGEERAAFPIALHVFSFSLPKEHTISTAFGFSASLAARYHGVTDPAQKRALFDLYMRNWRDHRISPYHFAPYDPIRLSLNGLPWEGSVERVRTTPYRGSFCLKLSDTSETTNVSAQTRELIPIEPGQSYVVSWAARAPAASHTYLVTVQTYDARGRWIAGRNIDYLHRADSSWSRLEEKLIVTDHSPQARFVRIALRATRWDEKGRPTGTTFFDEVSFRQSDTSRELVPDGGFERGAEAARVRLDFSAWDRQAKRYLDAFCFDSFRLRLEGMGGGTFHRRYEGRLGPFRQGTVDYRVLFHRYASKVEAHLREKGWLKKAYVYWFDEPEKKDYPFVRRGMAEIKKAAGGLRRMLTEQPQPELYGFVDVWCPVLSRADPRQIRSRLEAGETVWWYVCTGPKAPYLGLFIDHPATDMRVWPLLSWKWGVTGLLVWQTNYWTSRCAYPEKDQNPWEDPMSYVSGYGRPPGYIGYWGNGDGRFLYPPRRCVKTPRLCGPIDSIRWELLRDGIEHYEYLALLERLIERQKRRGRRAGEPGTFEALLKVPDRIVKDGKTYTKRAAPILSYRQELAGAIEALLRR